MIEITDHWFRASDLLAEFESRCDGAGGIVSFSGHVRSKANMSAVTALELEHHPTLTKAMIGDTVAKAEARWNLIGCHVRHRVGVIPAGEAIVFVATAAEHRRAAFEAADYLMDYLKSQAPFWKKEHRGDGAVWIEPRAEDYKDLKRWTMAKDA